MKSVLLLFPHQLYLASDLPNVETVVIVEESLYFGMDQTNPMRFHKQKLILHRASMRRYVEEVLWPAGYKTEYVDLDVLMNSGDVLEKANKADQIYIIDPTDDVLTKRLLQARRNRPDLPNLTFLSSPNFYLKEHEIRQYFQDNKSHNFNDFYQWQRERFNILIGDDYKPVGGKWSFETEHRRKLADDALLPSFGVFGDNKHVQDAIKWVNDHFPDHPGGTEFIWPTNHSEAKTWLDDFVENRLDDFAIYQNNIDVRSPWLYHSLLESSLNIGLLKPQDIVNIALARHARKPVPLESLENFIRQILGWREYTRGEYIHNATALRTQNVFSHHRKLTTAWYHGSTGLPPMDDLINKLNQHGYAHPNELRMIAGNLMILCEIQPNQIGKWISEFCLDSYDWTVLPNINGLNMFTNGTVEGNLPLATSEELLEISNYQKGDWSDVWDGLYWRFVEKNQSSLSKNPHTRVLIQRLKHLDPDHKRIIHYRAEDFLNQHTTA